MSPRILVVDKDPAIRNLLRRLFERRGHEVAEAGSANAALARFTAEHFDLIITEVELQGSSGVWLLERVRSLRPDVPIILLAAGGGLDSQESWRRASAIVQKPFPLRELDEKVQHLLELTTR